MIYCSNKQRIAVYNYANTAFSKVRQIVV